MNIKESGIIKRIAGKVKEHFQGEGSGHDWWHVYRVWRLSRQLAEGTGADLFVVELAALMHDMADHKLTIPEEGEKQISAMLEKEEVAEGTAGEVLKICRNVSFKGADVDASKLSYEGQIVQDADRHNLTFITKF